MKVVTLHVFSAINSLRGMVKTSVVLTTMYVKHKAVCFIAFHFIIIYEIACLLKDPVLWNMVLHVS
jgi:hypothetical protein